jgi:hypothetical protein
MVEIGCKLMRHSFARELHGFHPSASSDDLNPRSYA